MDESAGSPARLDLLIALGRAMHEAGFPTPELEESLGRVARRLGVQAQFFSTPTSLFFAFGHGAAQSTHLERVEPAGVDLGLVAAIDELIDRLADGSLASDQALAALGEIHHRPTPYPRWLGRLSWGVSSAATAIFLGGDWHDVAIGGAIGFAIGLAAATLESRPRAARVFEPAAAAFAAFVATSAAVLWPSVSTYIATLAGIIFLIPGYTLTVALAELAQRHLSAGTARFASALVVFLTLTFGTALGSRLAELVFGAPPTVAPGALEPWLEWLALGLAPLALTVLFRAPLSAVPWIVGTGALGYQAARLGGGLFSPELGMFLGALAIGLASRIFARVTGRPAELPLVPSILLLVPGSIGYRSLASLLQHDVVLGIETAFRMILIAVSLVAGLLLAAAVGPERRHT